MKQHVAMLLPLCACVGGYQTGGTHALDSTPIVVAETYSASPERVWHAIVDYQQLPQWFFEPIADFKPELGYKTRFTVKAHGKAYVHLWEVTEVIPHKRLVYRWRYEGIVGDSTVAWDIDETPNGTKLTLTHTGHDTFPQEDPAFSRELGVAGWTHFLQDSLKTFLERDAGENR